MLEPDFARLIDSFRAVLDSTTGHDEEKPRRVESAVADLTPLRNMACVEVLLAGGDADFLQERADEVLEEALDFFQICIQGKGGWPPNVSIVAGQLPYRVAPFVLAKRDASRVVWQKSVEHMHRATINEDSVTSMIIALSSPPLS